MCSGTVIILFVFITQSRAKELVANQTDAQISVDNLVNRVLNASLLRCADLDATTFGKPGHYTIPPQPCLSLPLSKLSHTFLPGGRLQAFPKIIAHGVAEHKIVQPPLEFVGRTVIESSFNELSEVMGGAGKATAIWRALREGNNPLEVSVEQDDQGSFQGFHNKGLSPKAKERLRSLLGSSDKAFTPCSQNIDDLLIPCAVGVENLASCGTRKYLSTLYDGNQIESVLIPNSKFNRTTLCVSTQIGCDRGCTFCATAKMGLIRNLTASEIVAQAIRGLHISKRERMPIMSNIVFMGMGDAGRNVDEVGKAVRSLTDQKRLGFGEDKVTVSTVGPSPEIFQALADLPCMIAWSLHAADNDLRKKLVPSTRHSTEQLRDGLISAMASRQSMRKKTLMIAVALIDGINDSEEDAERLTQFLHPIREVVPKLVVDLIPYNDINVKGFSKPSREAISKYQQVVQAGGYFVSVRISRGDDESAACGMLKTKRQKMLT